MIPRRLLSITILSAAAMLAVPGCGHIQDGIATISGAPTSKEFDAIRAAIEDAEAREREAVLARDALVEQRSAEQDKAASISAQREALEAQYAAMAGQLVGLAGEARAAMVEMMDGLRRRIDHVGDLQRQQAEIVASYGRAIAQTDRDLAALSTAVESSEAEFAAKVEQRDQVLSGLSAAVETVAGLAVSFGAPAASVEAAKGAIGVGLGLAVGGAPTGALAWWMRRKANARAAIIKATERYDLLADAEPDRKAQAKATLTASQAAELAKITAPIAKITHSPRAGASSAAA